MGLISEEIAVSGGLKQDLSSLPRNWIGRRQWHPTPVLLPGKSHGHRSLVGCSPRDCEKSDTTERLHFHFSLPCSGEGNGNPLQDSCLINPMRRSLTGYGPWRSHRVKQDLATEQQLVYYLYQMYHINAPEKTGCRICGNSLPCFSVNLHYSKTKSLFLKPQKMFIKHISHKGLVSRNI